MSTPNMGLVLPTDHGSSDVWDTILDAVFSLIDAHDHTTGKGVPIPSAALGINADVSWAGFALTAAKGFGFTEQASTSITSYSDLLYVDSTTHNLMFRNSSGVNVQITAGNTLNVSIVGGIGGDYASVGALLSFDDATKRYLLQSEGTPRPWSGLATADIDLYEKAASIIQKVTLKSPSSLAASYNWIFPTALPAATAPVVVSSAGQLSTQSGLLINRQVFTANGTYTPTAGTRAILVRMVGGGGGGGGAAGSGATGHAAAGGGGASGAYVELFASATTTWGAITAGGAVVVGAAGAAGAAGASSGGDGGDTSITVTAGGVVGTIWSAKGGKGGAGAASVTSGTNAGGGANTASTSGDFNYFDPGGTGMSSGNGIYTHSGRGGHSHMGRGGSEVFGNGADGQTAGNAGTGHGAGGSGGYSGCTTTSSTAVAGGAGTAGIVIIDEYL